MNICFPLLLLMPITIKMPEGKGTLNSDIKTSWVN